MLSRIKCREVDRTSHAQSYQVSESVSHWDISRHKQYNASQIADTNILLVGAHTTLYCRQHDDIMEQ